MEDESDARDQASSQLESIDEMLRVLAHAQTESHTNEDCDDNLYKDTENAHDEDAALQAIQEDALEINTRTEFNGEKEYMILLCTGGPACRIIGDIDEHDQPSSARLEYQDWGTPWTDYPLTQDNEQTLIEYARHYYFEEAV